MRKFLLHRYAYIDSVGKATLPANHATEMVCAEGPPGACGKIHSRFLSERLLDNIISALKYTRYMKPWCDSVINWAADAPRD